MPTPFTAKNIQDIQALLASAKGDTAEQITAIIYMSLLARSYYNDELFNTFMINQVKPLISFLAAQSGITWEKIESKIIEPLKNNRLDDPKELARILKEIFGSYNFDISASKLPDNEAGQAFKDGVVACTKKMIGNAARKFFNKDERYDDKTRSMFKRVSSALDKNTSNFNLVLIALVFLGVNASKLPTPEAKKDFFEEHLNVILLDSIELESNQLAGDKDELKQQVKALANKATTFTAALETMLATEFKDPDGVSIDFKKAYDLVMASQEVNINSIAVNLLATYATNPNTFDPTILFEILKPNILTDGAPSVPSEDMREVIAKLSNSEYKEIAAAIQKALDHLDQNSLKTEPTTELLTLFNKNLDYYVEQEKTPSSIDFIVRPCEALQKSSNKNVREAASALQSLAGMRGTVNPGEHNPRTPQPSAFENFKAKREKLDAMRQTIIKLTTPPVAMEIKEIFNKSCDIIERQMKDLSEELMKMYQRSGIDKLESKLDEIADPEQIDGNKDEVLSDFKELLSFAKAVQAEMVELRLFFAKFPEKKAAWDDLFNQMKKFAEKANDKARKFSDKFASEGHKFEEITTGSPLPRRNSL